MTLSVHKIVDVNTVPKLNRLEKKKKKWIYSLTKLKKSEPFSKVW